MLKSKENHLKRVKNLLYRGIGCAHSIDNNEVSHIEASDQVAFAYGLGHAHAKQRGLQVGLMQLILQARLNEFLGDDDQLIETDHFMEQFSFYYHARREETQLEQENREYLQAYIDGLNEGRRLHYPIEFKALKIPFIKWTMADTLSLLKLMGFLGLAQTQLDAEKFIAQSLAKGVDYQFLRSLFHPCLPEKCPTDLALFPQIKFDQTIIPENYFFQSIPALKNSNNWVTRSDRNSANTTMMAFDPHLEVNRLPALWFESVWYTGDKYSMGITLPGIPGFIMGRNNNLAFSFTYGFMDTFDYFIETIQDSLVYQSGTSAGLNSRKVVKKKKDGTELTSFLFSTDRGILEVAPEFVSSQGKIRDGLYLSRAWSGEYHGAGEAIEVLRKMHLCQDVDEACLLAKRLFISANWLFCDSKNNIAYQQSGYLPKRSRNSDGLIALDASHKHNHWRDYSSEEVLITQKNPDVGYLCSANNLISGSRKNKSITLPIADYRARRVAQLLEEDNQHNYQKAKAMQSDLLSLQAKSYLDNIRPFIPDTPNGRLLNSWDLYYDKDSIAASLFENFLNHSYEELLTPIIGQRAWLELSNNTHFVVDYYGLLDRILLRPEEKDRCCFYSDDDSVSVKNLSIDHLKRSLLKTLSTFPIGKIKPWGKKQQFTFSHILLGNKAPKWLPINHGPFALPGSRATIHQGNLYNHKGRPTSFAPSYRFISAIADSFAFTILPGGPSDRFWKKGYKSEVKLWLAFQYKTLKPFLDQN
jgi:penicillin amidase